MSEQDIIDTLKIYRPLFKKKSVLELQEIMDFLKIKLKNQNNNWSTNCLEDFFELYKIQLFTLQLFYKEYSQRKKQVKTFESLLNRYEIKEDMELKKFMITNVSSYFKNELIDKAQISEFLKELGGIKRKYLNGTDNHFIQMISKNIKTGYKESTLRNYYYNNKN